jgi:uncharacterized protein with FMN-binding domain
MATATATRPGLEPSAAARLAALQDRRRNSADDNVDEALKARLDKLAAARNGAGRSKVAPTARTNAPTKKRRHPAQHSRTAALTLSVLASGGLAFLFARTDQGVSASQAAPAGVVTAPTKVAAAPPAAVAPVAPTPAQPLATDVADDTATTSPSTVAAAPPADAITAEAVTINGDSFGTKWGDVQIQATFAGDGTLTDVTVLQVPEADRKSATINARAVPRLNSEALSAQSADIDTVSGATYTSIGYKKSLQSAIDIAIANGVPTVAATT